MLLADIGNSRVHIYDGNSVVHLSHDEAFRKYHSDKVLYISVASKVASMLETISSWQDISECLTLQGSYDTMGVDRKALCMSRSNGIFVDAGSAITVDIVQDSIYMGGFILLGIEEYLKGYRDISSALDIQLNKQCNLDLLPKTTKDSISYGIIASIKNVIDFHAQNLPLFFTGGDGKWLSSFFANAIFDETLVFQGMQKALKDTKC